MIVQSMMTDARRACSCIAGKPETGDVDMLILHKRVRADRKSALHAHQHGT